MRQLCSSLGISLLLIFGVLESLGGQQPEKPTRAMTLAASGDVYCVVSRSGTLGPFAACRQVFTGIQAAVDTARGGEKILVATGRYTEVQARKGLTQIVYLSKTLHLQGGYRADFSAWDPDTYPTVLDAEQQGRVFYASGPISLTIEGFEITGGQATLLGGGEGDNVDAGGGIYLNGVTVTLRHNHIHHNLVGDQKVRTQPFETYAGLGGGLYLVTSTALVENNTINDNTALASTTLTPNIGLGGGLFSQDSDITIINNALYNNIANDGAGGEGVAGGLNIEGGEAYLASNQIHRNTACIPAETSGCALSPGGGILIENSSRVTLLDNQILSNTAVISGHDPDFSVAFGGGVAIADSEVSLQDNLIQGNIGAISVAHAYGGGIYFEGSTITLTGNTIAQNLANRYGFEGNGGGVAMQAQNAITETIILEDNLIQENWGSLATNALGGGIYVFSQGPIGPIAKDQVYLRRNQILSNTASLPDPDRLLISVGGGVLFRGNILTVDGDIIRFNQAQTLGSGLYLERTRANIVNTVIADDLWGVGLFMDRSEAHLRHTTIARNQGVNELGVGIMMDFDGGSTLYLTNTIIADQAGGIAGMGSHTITIDSILWYNTPVTVVDTLTPYLSAIRNEYTGSPDFLADGYHIGVGSAAVGRGIATGVETDIDGQPRLSGPDLGADEYIRQQPYLPLILQEEK